MCCSFVTKSHWLHLYVDLAFFILIVWTWPMCLFNWKFIEKDLEHCPHLNVLFSVWMILICLLRVNNDLKLSSQLSHWNNRTSMWTEPWIFRAVSVLNVFLHWMQGNNLSALWTMSSCFLILIFVSNHLLVHVCRDQF